MDVKDILIAYLTANGYDGLCSDECGCGIDDLAPCDNRALDCVPAHQNKCPGCPEYGGCELDAKDDCTLPELAGCFTETKRSRPTTGREKEEKDE